jgi:hypothetical protein
MPSGRLDANPDPEAGVALPATPGIEPRLQL